MTTTPAPALVSRNELSRKAAIVAALALAAIHLVLAPEELEEMPYLGVLFVVGSALLVFAAVALIRGSMQRAAWMTGVLVSAGMFVGYLASRMTGLPGAEREEWGSPLGMASLLLEVAFVAAAALVYASRSTGRTAPATD